MSVKSPGWAGYDTRTLIRARSGEALELGQSCFIADDGLAYLCDNESPDRFHGSALSAAAQGGHVVLVTHGFLELDERQTPGARLYTGAIAGGSAPSTTHASDGVVAGFAVEEHLVFVHVSA